MEAIIIPKNQFEQLLNKVERILSHIDKVAVNPKETFVSNEEFIKLMNISHRTAQIWRDEKRVAFSQVGRKIYYRLSDVEELLQSNLTPLPSHSPRKRPRQ